MKILDLRSLDAKAIRQAATQLVTGFQEKWPSAWPDIDDAIEEVEAALDEGKICRVAVSEDGEVVGWIGGIPHYEGNAWELHPLVVEPLYQHQGVGTALVRDLEDRVREEGGITIYLGTDDESGMTNLAGLDLYPHVIEHLSKLRSKRSHPFEFYVKLGYTVVGVIPDANGFGKPDIIMAKRIES